jgi:ribonuclease P protein subunit RPR2
LRKIYKRILELLEYSLEEVRSGNINLARNYSKLAFSMAKKARLRIDVKYKRKFCRKCYVPLIINETCIIRIKGKVIYRFCKVCGNLRRFKTPLRDEVYPCLLINEKLLT